MEPCYSPAAERFRAQVRRFVLNHLPEGWQGLGQMSVDERRTFVETWREVLRGHGYLAVSWPKQHGGAGLSLLERSIVHEELARAGLPTGNANDIFSIRLVGHVLLAVGTDAQRAHFLPRILSGEHRWCQGYSEPDHGSDLAGVDTVAVLDGDSWLVRGQKVWTSDGHTANWMLALCRTDRDAKKHAGLSLLMIPMDQPGVTVRPIVDMTGRHYLNEVFFEDAVTSAENVLGRVNDGWSVATRVLGFERGDGATTDVVSLADEFDRLLTLTARRGRTNDPIVRDRLMSSYCKLQAIRYLSMRALTSASSGASPGPESSLHKLFWTEYHREITELAVDIIGADAMAPSGRRSATHTQWDLPGSDDSVQSWVDIMMGARTGTIAAGTSEIQRSIIGEKVLGLPREPR